MSENADPNENFNLFMQTFSTLKEKYLPKRRVIFNKRKHSKKPWLTQGLLNSINAKDKLYKRLLQTPTDSPDYQQLKTNVKTYKNIIRRAIMHAKRDYYRKTFNQFSDNIRKTWQTINDTLNRKRRSKDFPQEFILSNGKIISDHKQIANEFNDFFISIGEPKCQNKDATYILLVNMYQRKQILIHYSRQLRRKRLVTLLTV